MAHRCASTCGLIDMLRPQGDVGDHPLARASFHVDQTHPSTSPPPQELFGILGTNGVGETASVAIIQRARGRDGAIHAKARAQLNRGHRGLPVARTSA